MLKKLARRVRVHGGAATARFLVRSLYLQGLSALAAPLKSSSTRDPVHRVHADFVSRVNRLRQPALLEIGSRNVTGHVQRRAFPNCRTYVGFDVHPGDNVDVVGDAHELAAHFPDTRFDAILAQSVFEHLVMPWKAVLEINQVLQPQGLLFIGTHPTWPPHERPWDFWRFSKDAFAALLNPYTGFEIIEAVEGQPCSILPLCRERPLRRMCRTPAWLGVAVLARKTGPVHPGLAWDVPPQTLVQAPYPVTAR
ncbi:class I SAM-dependent methyltransferase [bacterium]|nr:class I SAM-dependent methyltransferase [bacterium]